MGCVGVPREDICLVSEPIFDLSTFTVTVKVTKNKILQLSLKLQIKLWI